jgi:F-type H+-transporting ATPase subunit gamma
VAGSGLIGIKRRIKSVTNTSKITKAMGLVATSKFRKTKEELYRNQLYTDSFNKIIADVEALHETSNIYKDGNGSSKKLYIVITSDSGLCGSFNANIINRAVEEIKNQGENSIIMVIGAKGISYLNRFNYEAAYKYTDIPDIPKLGTANDFAMMAWQMYKNSEVGQVNVVYSHFISQSKQEVMVEQLLPLSDEKDLKRDSSSNFVIIEPEIDIVLREIIPLYMREKLLNCLLQSKTSEQATRMTAMDGATKNANQLLDRLKLQFNRLRQSAITQEISEIVGGAEAQK